MNFPSGKDDWKKSEKNNPTITLNVLYTKNKKNYSAYASRHNSKREESGLLKTLNNGKWHYLTIKNYLHY